MITKEEKREVTTNLEGQQFTVASTSYTFKVLSDKLYSNKIRAIIRELATNAYDSHSEAKKKNTPFTVHLPNELEPTFYVEDYGTGMSEEKILDLYSSYFASDKRGTNQAVGTFGLGSKSPFAYKGSFTVISRFEGEETVYSCYLDEHEIPCIAKIFTTETPHCNGVKVEIPVDQRDFREFYNEAKSVLRPFDIDVTVIGADSFEILPYPEVIMEGEGYKIFVRNTSNRAYSLAVQGNIEYGIETSKLFYSNEWEEFKKKYNLVNSVSNSVESLFEKNDFLLDIPIGKVTFPPSREHLEYTPYTKKNLIHIMYRVYNEVKEKIVSELENRVDNRMLLIEAVNNYSNILRGEYFNTEGFEINGVKVKDHLAVHGYEHKKDFEVIDCEEVDRYNDTYKVKSIQFKQENLFRAFLPFHHNSLKEVRAIYHDEQDNESRVRSGIYRLKQHIRKDHFRAVIIYNKNLIDDLSLTSYDKISNYEYIKKPGRKKSSTVDTSKIKKEEIKLEFRPDGSYKIRSYHTQSTIGEAISDTCTKAYLRPYYSKFTVPHYKDEDKDVEIESFETTSYIYKLIDAQSTYKEFGNDTTIINIYHISKFDLNKKNVREANIQGFHEFLYKEWQKVDRESDFITYLKKKMYNMRARQEVQSNVQRNIVEMVKNSKLREVEGIKTAFEDVEAMMTTIKYDLKIDVDISALREYAKVFDLTNTKNIFKEEEEKNVYEELEKVYIEVVEKKYPMIGFLEWKNSWRVYKEESDWKKINQYIDLVDSNK